MKQNHITPIGTIRIDTVRHKSNFDARSSCWTLHAVCVASGWSERRAMMDCTPRFVVPAMEELIWRLPFNVLSIHVDKGKELINKKFHGFPVDELGIKMMRSRPYCSDDNPSMEVQNSNHIRKIVGFHTYSSEEECRALQDVYDVYGLIANLFQPSYFGIGYKRKGREDLKAPLDRLVDLFREENRELPEEVDKMLTLRDLLDMLSLYDELHRTIKALHAIRAKGEEIDS